MNITIELYITIMDRARWIFKRYRRRSEWLNRPHLSPSVIVCTNETLNYPVYSISRLRKEELIILKKREREKEYACVHWFSYITGRNEGWCKIYWKFSNKNEFSYVYSLYNMFDVKIIKNMKIFIQRRLV